jgi:GH24 family phage-related lysozyme (muramidase)
MATLAELITRERKSGSSRTGSLFSAVGKKTLETIDPRRMFNQSGVLTALFPSLKSYKAGAESSKVDSASKELSGSTAPILEQVVTKLDGLDITMRLVAKNTMAMPGMSRDMNIMRQNVIKLVRLQGGKASTKADAFFLRAFERERATEAELQAARERRATGKASPVTAIKESVSTGILGKLLTPILVAFSGISSVIKTLTGAMSSLNELLAPLLKGGISLLFDFAGSFAKMAIKGGGTLFDFVKKIPLGKMLRGLLSFISSKGALAALPVAAAGGLLTYLITHEATQSGTETSDSLGAEFGMDSTTAPPPPPPTDTDAQLRQSRESMRKSDNAAVRQAAADLDRTSPLSTSPTPIPLSVFESMAVSMIKKHEGLPKNGKAYKDGSGHSIGYGHFITPAEKERGYIIAGDEKIPINQENILETKITPEQAEKLLSHDLPKYISAAKRPLGEAWDKLNDMQKATLVSSAYNTGQGGIEHLVKKGLKDAIMRGDFKAAGEIIKEHGFKTSMVDGERKTLSALVNRRAEEGAIIASQSASGGSQLMAASSTVDSARMDAMAPSAIIPAMANLAAPKTPSLQKQQVNIPSTVDTDLYEGLVARITEYA